MLLPRTLAVTDKLLRDVERILYWTTIVVQFIFFGYYGYSIYTNLASFPFLVTYSLLFLFSSTGFIYYLANYRNKKDNKVRTVKLTFRIFKYVINGSMLALNIYEVVTHGGSNIAYGLVVFSSISLLIQIIIELIRGFISLYIDMFSYALEKDLEFITKFQDALDVKTQALKLVDTPLEKIHKTKKSRKEPELNKNQKLVESLALERKTKNTHKKKQRRASNFKRETGEIKEHLNMTKNKVFNALKKVGKKKNKDQK